MGKMTENTFATLYEYGKKVFSGEMSTDEAAKQVTIHNPEIAESSASHYITWYSKMRSGEYLTWNTNSKFLLYFAKRIYAEEGQEAGELAFKAATLFARHAARTELEDDLKTALSALQEEKPNDISVSKENQFRKWLKNNKIKTYTDHTVYRYIHAINSIEKWLGITLGCSVFYISNPEEFNSTYQEILDCPNFEEVNQAHGHGDLSAALSLYRKFLSDNEEQEDDWWPSLDVYNPGISIAQWLDLLKDGKTFTGNAYYAIAAMYDHGGIASCKELEEKYGKTSDFYRSSLGTQLASKVKSIFDLPYCFRTDGTQCVWPILFQGRDAGKEESGSYIWRIRPELYDALTEFDILRYLSPDRRIGQFDSWEIIDESTAVKHCDKSFFEHNGSGVPKGICWYFNADHLEAGETVSLELHFNGKTYTGRVSNESSDRRRVRIFWAADLGREFAKFRADDAAVTFKRIADETYEISFAGGEEEVIEINTRDALAEIKNYIFARGFDYPEGLIENFYLSLKSKPFVILAGTSGTGKTRLVKLFAEAIGAAFKLVSVRPDWSDGSDLFGHTDLNGNFIPGLVCSAFETAVSDPKRPVFLCLDEMNLARVEYYLSDFLSVIESREKVNGHIVTEGIAQYTNGIPENLYIIGTVNMDETTFPFSKKVLDRANTIEFSYVDLMPKQRTGETFAPQMLPNSFLCTEYLVLATDCMEEAELVNRICTELQALNGKLVKANAHVGFRVRDEIVFYMLNNKKAGNLLTFEQALDNEIMQKILPRIQGSSAAIKTLLIDMFKFCMGSGSGIDADTGNVGEQMKNAAASAKYPKSAEKIGYMMTRFEDDGFTSYWL